VKMQQVQACQTYYRRGVSAWGKLEEALTNFLRTSRDRPPGRAAWRDLEGAFSHLHVLGEALAVVPGLVEDLAEEKRIGDLLRRQAAERGLIFRYEESSDDSGRFRNDKKT